MTHLCAAVSLKSAMSAVGPGVGGTGCVLVVQQSFYYWSGDVGCIMGWVTVVILPGMVEHITLGIGLQITWGVYVQAFI